MRDPDLLLAVSLRCLDGDCHLCTDYTCWCECHDDDGDTDADAV